MKLQERDYVLLFEAISLYQEEFGKNKNLGQELSRLDEKLKKMYVQDAKFWLPVKRFCTCCRKVSEMFIM